MDALGDPNPPETERKSRDQLLPDLMVSLVTDPQPSSTDALVDAAVSVGLVRASEKTLDYAVSLSIASGILAAGGEFARLKEFRSSFSDIASQFESQRPYFALALSAFARVIAGNIPDAVRRLNEGLGLGDPEPPPLQQVPVDWTSVGDVFLANALRRWLITGSVERLEESRAIATSQNDALLFASASLFMAYAQESSKLSLASVAPSISPIFNSPQLKRFLQGSDIKTIFPSQSDAIHAGVLEEGSFLVAMPTSSGKTFLALLRIAADLTRSPNGRVIYLAPYRLLANQVATEMRRDLSRLRLRIQDLGSSCDVSFDELLPTDDLPDVAVMTPERL